MSTPLASASALVLVLAMLVIATPAVADEDGEGARVADAVQLRSGQVLLGRVVDYDGATVTIELASGGKTRLPAAQLAPLWQYRLRAAHRAPSGPDGHLALARFAAGLGLMAQAREHLKQARDLDSAAGGALATRIELRLAELDELAAGRLFEQLTAALERKRYQQASELIDAITRRYPKSAPASWAADLEQAVDEALAARDQAKRDPADDERQAEARREVKRETRRQRQIDSVRRQVDNLIHAADKAYRDGLRDEAEDKISSAMRAFEAGSGHYRDAVRGLDALEKRTTRAKDARELIERRQQVVHRWVLLAQSAAHVRARQGNYKDAQRWLSLARRFEPLNERVIAFKKVIDKARIHFSLAEWTNTKPIIKSN